MYLLSQAKLVFFDFDGVIKDSINVKTQAYVDLFQVFGRNVVAKVSEHHKAHGGMSRFEKLPLYLSWAGEEPSNCRINEFCQAFSQRVFQDVIDSPWVPGVEIYLRANLQNQTFILVSATPQNELEQILHELNLYDCFSGVFGAPLSKKDAIRQVLDSEKAEASNCIMIGDARSDFEAAQANEVAFLLRRHSDNAAVFCDYDGLSIEDFIT